MKLLFAVDHIFTATPDGAVYTTGGKFPYSAWESYLEVFNSVEVISRGVKRDAAGNLARSDGRGVEFSFVPGSRGLRRIASIPEHISTVRSAVARADCVVARLPSETALMACAIAHSTGKPYLVELVACPWDALWHHGSLAMKAYAPVLAGFTRLATLQAPAVRYVTQSFLQGRYPTRGKEFVASNVMLMRPGSPRKYVKSNPITFGTIGALHTKLKGIDVAMTALAEVRRRRPDANIEYRVLGEGDPEPFMRIASELGMADRVHFDGMRTPGDAVAEWLGTLDFYLQPSFQEGLPRALIEAMNTGLVSIGSTAGGIPELLPDNRVHAPGDSARLSQLMEVLLSLSPDDLNSESERNYLVAQNYALSRVTEKRLNSLKFLAQMAQK